MPTIRQLKRRIQSVKNTAKITNALQLVAASKMRRAQDRAGQAKPYAEKLRVVLAGLQLGIMQACLDVVVPYVRERKQFGKAIGQFQLMQAKVADMYVALNSARAYVYAVAKNCDAGLTTRFDAAGAILLASESAVKVAGEAILFVAAALLALRIGAVRLGSRTPIVLAVG